MGGGVRRQPSDRLFELPLRSDLPTAACLVPRDRNVDEALEEIAFRAGRGAPRELELLVRGEVLAAPDQLNSLEEATRRFRREGGRALLVRPSNPHYSVPEEVESSLRLDSCNPTRTSPSSTWTS
jgi:hypothetical protein